jgi:phenylpyruvate tautomerase
LRGVGLMLVTVPGFIVFMPYLSIHTNANLGVDRQSELLAAASKIGSSQLSKPEEYMMVSITPVGRLFFGGSEDPAAFLELKSIGVPDGKRNLLCAELTDLIAGKCGIAKNRIYLVMIDVEARFWGHKGKPFA